MDWKEIKRKMGEDPLATIIYLYVDELAKELGGSADDYGDPAVVLSRLADPETGEVDVNVLDVAERRAWIRYREAWEWLLGPAKEIDYDAFQQALWELGL